MASSIHHTCRTSPTHSRTHISEELSRHALRLILISKFRQVKRITVITITVKPLGQLPSGRHAKEANRFMVIKVKPVGQQPAMVYSRAMEANQAYAEHGEASSAALQYGRAQCRRRSLLTLSHWGC
jgi:hypothetical protein